MRLTVFLVTAVSLCLVGAAALAQDPVLALISTEVDDGLDGAGTFVDREVLSLYPPGFPWSWDTNDVFFDPGDVLGIETGLDAFDIRMPVNGAVPTNGPVGPLYYFSTEVDFDFEGTHYTDEDLLVYDPVLGLLSRAWDSKVAFGGADLGFDATCWFYDDHDGKWLLTFSTEVGGTALIDGNPTTFTSGDILVTDGTSLVGWLDMTSVFGSEVGLDGLHIWMEAEGPDSVMLKVLFSTEVDGVVRQVDGIQDDLDPLIAFKDQDLLIFGYAFGDGPGALVQTELAWQGIEDGFGKDVGLDAVYIQLPDTGIPEPATMVLMGLGLAALGVRLRRRG
ncbi:MAG: PEP-CTERM sorting domain-containing protein [Verrucomicrobia bacterium]|nr:PEP-CTERM sorting domain-containing protein [Verrucomicrobiota bacterium]